MNPREWHERLEHLLRDLSERASDPGLRADAGILLRLSSKMFVQDRATVERVFEARRELANAQAAAKEDQGALTFMVVFKRAAPNCTLPREELNKALVWFGGELQGRSPNLGPVLVGWTDVHPQHPEEQEP